MLSYSRWPKALEKGSQSDSASSYRSTTASRKKRAEKPLKVEEPEIQEESLAIANFRRFNKIPGISIKEIIKKGVKRLESEAEIKGTHVNLSN